MANLHGNLKTNMAAIVNKAYWTLGEDNGFRPPFLQVNLQVLRSLVASRCYLKMLQWIHSLEKFMFHEPLACLLILATGFDFREKNRACFRSIGVPTLASVSYLVAIL